MKYIVVCVVCLLLVIGVSVDVVVLHFAGGCPVLFQHIFLHQCFNVQLLNGAGSGIAALPVSVWNGS